MVGDQLSVERYNATNINHQAATAIATATDTSVDLCPGSTSSTMQNTTSDAFGTPDWSLSSEMSNACLSDQQQSTSMDFRYQIFDTLPATLFPMEEFDFNWDFPLFSEEITDLDLSLFEWQPVQVTPEITHDQQQTKYQCEFCPRSYSQQHKLNRHIRTHTRPFKCENSGCTHAFADNRDLKRHMKVCRRSGATKKNLTCQICNFPTARADSLQRHVRTKHANLAGVTTSGAFPKLLPKQE